MFLDTTILVEVLRGSGKVVRYVENVAEREPLMFSIVQVGELADWCYSNNFHPSKVLDEVRSIATPVGITEDVCLEGSRIKQGWRKAGKGNFSLIDGFIAASAMSLEQKLLTKDRAFEGLEHAIIL